VRSPSGFRVVEIGVPKELHVRRRY
jgi:hypothetical protein